MFVTLLFVVVVRKKTKKQKKREGRKMRPDTEKNEREREKLYFIKKVRETS